MPCCTHHMSGSKETRWSCQMAEQTHGSDCCNHQVAVPFVTHKRLGVFSCLLVFLSFPQNSKNEEKKKRKRKKDTPFQFRGNWQSRDIYWQIINLSLSVLESSRLRWKKRFSWRKILLLNLNDSTWWCIILISHRVVFPPGSTMPYN